MPAVCGKFPCGAGVFVRNIWYAGAIEEIMYLYVGDYVEYYIYATPQIQVYYNYLYFAGWFVG